MVRKLTRIQIIQKRIEDLEILAEEIEKIGIELIEKAPLVYKPNPPGVLSPVPDYQWEHLPEELKKLQREVVRKYQRWYSTAHQLIKEYLPNKEKEFIDYYEDAGFGTGIMDYLRLRKGLYNADKKKAIEDFIDKFEIQRSILLSIPDVIGIKELNLRKLITADFVETELDEAKVLFKNGFERAAGALAGVALEKHLKTQCDINGIDYPPKATIEPLAQALYKAGILDITELKKVQYLASIRNKCAHPENVNRDEIKSLIEEVRRFV